MAISIFMDEDNASFTSSQITNTVYLLEIATDTYDESYNDWITKLYCNIDCQCGDQPYLFSRNQTIRSCKHRISSCTHTN